MPGIKILDERRYPLPMMNKDLLPYYRFEHRATLGRNGKTYIVMVDNGIIMGANYIENPTCWVEDFSSGTLVKIKDDELWSELVRFIEEKGFHNVIIPMMKGQ
jgi:hypothetical protein